MNNTVISPVYPMLIQKYNTLIPDPNDNVLDKINTIIDYLNQTGKLTNDVVDNWNKVMAWAMNDGLSTDVSNKLETMLSNGEFDTLFQKYIAPSLGDITLLQTVDKSSVVNAVNENVGKIASNTASLADIAKQFGTAPPTTGTWQLADKVWNTNPVSGGIVGWICVQAGTFGGGNDPIFKEFGIISS